MTDFQVSNWKHPEPNPLYYLQFSNLCGTVYTGGNILFTEKKSPSGNEVKDQILLSPVGNKVSAFDLTK